MVTELHPAPHLRELQLLLNVTSPVIIPATPVSTEHLVEPSSWGSCDHSSDVLHLEELLSQVFSDEEHQTGRFHCSCDQLCFP